MENDEHTVRYSADELEKLLRQGADQTDWARVDAETEADLEAAIDHGDEGEVDWRTVQVGIPGPKRQLTVRFDVEVIEWFKAQGPGYQTRMNAVLKHYVEAQRRRHSTKTAR